ncbi:hypothetical protein [Adonisia turfae]
MTSTRRTIEVQPESCYIAIAPRPPGRLSRRIAAFAAEGQLPRPLEDLCLSWRVAGDRLVVVAVDRERAEAWLTEGLESAVVAELPSDADLIDAPIELLTDEFVPASIRRHRGNRFAAMAAVLALGCASLAVGLQQRTQAVNTQIDAADERTASLARGALPDLRAGMSPELALTGELRRLRSMATGDREDSPPDSRTALAAVLASWPAASGFRVESIESAGGRVDIRAIAPTREDAIELSAELAQKGGLDAGLPRVRTEPERTGEVTRVELTLTERPTAR